MYAAAKTSFATCLMFCSLACGAAPDHDTLMRLHVMPDKERIEAFNKLDNDSKLELFFIDSAAHPPLGSLQSAFAMQDACFARRLRIEVEQRYIRTPNSVGVPEVLGLLGVVSEMKHLRKITIAQIQELRLENICALAAESRFCPEFLLKVLSGSPASDAKTLADLCDESAE